MFLCQDWTLLHAACYRDVITKDEFADIYKSNPGQINKFTDGLMESCTPLHFAIKVETLWKAEFLVEHGADINSRNLKGQTPIMVAADKTNSKIVKYLLDKGADTAIKDNGGKTLLEYCKDNEDHNGFAGIIDLLEKASDISDQLDEVEKNDLEASENNEQIDIEKDNYEE